MKIGNKNIAEIQILDRDNDLIVSMVDENVIIEKDYKVVLRLEGEEKNRNISRRVTKRVQRKAPIPVH
jgi:hypothetical protein